MDFIDNVSGCYLIRDEYQAEVIDPLHKRIFPGDKLEFRPLDELLHIDVDYYVAYSTEIIHRLKAANELNKHIMGISDSELDKFTEKMVGINQDDLDSVYEAVEDEYMQSIFKRSDAMQKYYSKKATKKSNKKKNSKRKQNKR